MYINSNLGINYLSVIMGACSSSNIETVSINKLSCFYCQQNKQCRGYGNFANTEDDYMIRPEKSNFLQEPSVYKCMERILLEDGKHVEFEVYFYYSTDCNGCVVRKEKYSGKNVDKMPKFKRNVREIK